MRLKLNAYAVVQSTGSDFELGNRKTGLQVNLAVYGHLKPVDLSLPQVGLSLDFMAGTFTDFYGNFTVFGIKYLMAGKSQFIANSWKKNPNLHYENYEFALNATHKDRSLEFQNAIM